MLFALLPPGFGESLRTHQSASLLQGGDVHLVSPPIGSLELQLLGSTSSKKRSAFSVMDRRFDQSPCFFLMGLKRFLRALDQMDK